MKLFVEAHVDVHIHLPTAPKNDPEFNFKLENILIGLEALGKKSPKEKDSNATKP